MKRLILLMIILSPIGGCATWGDRSADMGVPLPATVTFERYDRRMLMGEGWLFRQALLRLTNTSSEPIWVPRGLAQPLPPPSGATTAPMPALRAGAQPPLRRLDPARSVIFHKWILEGGGPVRVHGWYATDPAGPLHRIDGPSLNVVVSN